MVQSGMRQGEKIGLDIFIQAEKAGLGVYKRLGFQVEKEVQDYSENNGAKGEHLVHFMIYEQNPTSMA